jgi:hypothetical protein
MNLYCVYTDDSEGCCIARAKTRGRAKQMGLGDITDDYTAMRARIIRKDVTGAEHLFFDDDDGSLAKLGIYLECVDEESPCYGKRADCEHCGIPFCCGDDAVVRW